MWFYTESHGFFSHVVFRIYLLDHVLSVFELTLGTFEAFGAKVCHKAIKKGSKMVVLGLSE